MSGTLYDRESLISDPVHGYIAFTAARDPGAERARQLASKRRVGASPDELTDGFGGQRTEGGYSRIEPARPVILA